MSPSNSGVKYGEDLSVHRPQIESDTLINDDPTENPPINATPEFDQTAALDRKLGDIRANNKTSSAMPGFTIQVYSGTSRDQASKAKAKVYRILPESRPETKYEQPVYKVRVGDFGDRLEAQAVYAQLQEEFPDAIVIPSRIRLN